MAQSKSRSPHQQTLYKLYQMQNRWEINKRRKIAKHLKNHPNDGCAAKALAGPLKYSRKNPKAPMWNKTDKAAAQLFAEAGHKGTLVLQMKKERFAVKTTKAPTNV